MVSTSGSSGILFIIGYPKPGQLLTNLCVAVNSTIAINNDAVLGV